MSTEALYTRPLQRFWSLLKPDRKEIRNVYVYAVFNGLINLSLPIGIQSIINIIQGGQVNTTWTVLVFFVILGIAMSGVMQINQLRITENLQQKIFIRAAFEFAYRIPRIKMEELKDHYPPELMNRFFDVVSVQKGLSKIVIDFSTASIQVLFGLILLSLYHPFFIIFSLILVVMTYIIFKLTANRGLRTSLKESKHKYKIAHSLEEQARTFITFKLAGKTDLPIEQIDHTSDKYISAREGHFKVLVNQYTLMIAFKVLVAMGLLIIGSILVMEQQMNIGQFVAAEIIIILIMNSVEKLVLSLETIYDVLTSLEKIGQVTDLELEDQDGMEIVQKEDNGMSVEMKDVTFTYPGSINPVVENVSFRIEKGQKLLITGKNNSGKSTLLYLLAGIYKLKQGSISYNDIPIGNYNPESLRSFIGDCLMEEMLFEGSILDNIAMGRERATFENVQWAIKNLGLSDFIKSLPEGYNTVIHPQGQQFSQGVIDKLILARCIADRPHVLLIKDAFRLFEKEERIKILNFLSDKKHGWTLIIASANPELEFQPDQIVDLTN
ncbi:MAG: ATP-binding cassette domain-containing protein [Crocinitomicaceae bacterium]|jgi:ABC-type bacteriocin/lantibiotic exporter with double-glycine peptidase domain|nr:ATP-binding cassette domain-containing protein [Crocinitomicaceae bacterium]